MSQRRRAFTLIELIVVIAIISVLVGILLPALQAARAKAVKTGCSANLRSIGIAVQVYKDEFRGVFPIARYMPPPFISGDTDPSLPTALASYLTPSTNADARTAYHCPGDDYVFKLAATSYMYQSELSGLVLEKFFPVVMFNIPASEVVVSRDFDGGTFDTDSGQIVVPPFHGLRNILFADSHVGNYAP